MAEISIYEACKQWGISIDQAKLLDSLDNNKGDNKISGSIMEIAQEYYNTQNKKGKFGDFNELLEIINNKKNSMSENILKYNNKFDMNRILTRSIDLFRKLTAPLDKMAKQNIQRVKNIIKPTETNDNLQNTNKKQLSLD